MARTQTTVPVPIERVFAVLADPYRYHEWVVGAKEIRDADATWPEVGSLFHHSVGVGPLTLKDNTQCLEVDAPTHIVLEARARPLGRARVDIRLEQVDGGTRVTMDEVATSPPLMKLLNPVLDPLVHVRNVESLRRLTAAATNSGS
ncbi:MAG: SRPBCC family protein [Acidimicrobiales bacterium]